MLDKLKTRLKGVNILFAATVVTPTILAGLYFGLVASDIYVSESQFVVRSPQKPSISALDAVLSGAGFARAQDDTYSVQEYILSRDALRGLNEKMALGKGYAAASVDRVSRFAGVDSDDSFEALHRYYKKMVSVQADSASSISTLTVRAFTAEDAANANRLLLEQAEALVNRLNERGRQDLIRFADSEVKSAEAKARTAALALSAYRDAQGVVDPVQQAAAQLQNVVKMQDELIATNTQLAQLRALTPANPQIPGLQNRARTLAKEIENETAKATGGKKSLANKAAEYQRLALDAEFASKQLASALASLESARNEAARKQVYLERIAEPSKPDVAQEPRRLRSTLAVLVLGLVAWGVIGMLLAGVREHHQ